MPRIRDEFLDELRNAVSQGRTVEIDAGVARWLLDELTALELARAYADTPSDLIDLPPEESAP